MIQNQNTYGKSQSHYINPLTDTKSMRVVCVSDWQLSPGLGCFCNAKPQINNVLIMEFGLGYSELAKRQKLLGFHPQWSHRLLWWEIRTEGERPTLRPLVVTINQWLYCTLHHLTKYNSLQGCRQNTELRCGTEGFQDTQRLLYVLQWYSDKVTTVPGKTLTCAGGRYSKTRVGKMFYWSLVETKTQYRFFWAHYSLESNTSISLISCLKIKDRIKMHPWNKTQCCFWYWWCY